MALPLKDKGGWVDFDENSGFSGRGAKASDGASRGDLAAASASEVLPSLQRLLAPTSGSTYTHFKCLLKALLQKRD